MTDCIEIGTDWEPGIELDDGYGMEIEVESGFGIEVETETVDESEVHLVIGDIVEEDLADDTPYDFGMEFTNTELVFVYAGPELPDESSTDAWFRGDGWFDSEGW